MTAIWSLSLAVAGLASVSDPTPRADRDIAIRLHHGRSVAVSEWIIKGKLFDGRPVVIKLSFSDKHKMTKIGLVVAGKSWGEQRIDETQFPKLKVQSLGLNEIRGHVQLIFEYDATDGCGSPGNLQPEVTVDFTPQSVKLYPEPGVCPRPSSE